MAITNARILIRKGLEADFNPDGLQPGEWALSVDRGNEKLRVCVSPGEFIRIATYESFEKDMAQIEAILAECETIEEAVTAIQSEINAKEVVFESYVQQAKGYSETAAAEASKATTEADRAESEADRAKEEADRASSVVNIGIATTEKAGIVKPDGTTITVDADGTMHSVGGGGTAGTTDYEDLSNKPSVNGVELSGNKTTADLGITAESVGADAAGSASTALSTAKDYTDTKIADLVGGAPSTLDTLKEISDALEESGEAVEAINQAIGNKLDKNGDSKDNTVTFTQASTRENIASTEKHSTLFGKIAKWFADLKAVAFSGSYNDLNDKPTIPTVNNGTLTIQKNGSTVQTFPANAASDRIANIIIPTKTSELENDSGFMGSATALDTYEEIMANTESGKFAGAKGVKEGFSAINDSLSKLIERLFPYGISLVPTLTSNTGSDGGEAFASSYHSNASTDYKAYKAFDGEESVENDTTKCWHAYWDNSSTFPQWLGYKFVEPVRATKFTVLPMYASDSGGSRVKTYKYQASNNNIDWVDLTEELIHANDFSKKSDEATKNIGEYLYYRIYIIDNYSTYAAAINELQFYEQL